MEGVMEEEQGVTEGERVDCAIERDRGRERERMDSELEENRKNLYTCILCVANHKSICRFSPKCHMPWEEPFNSPP